MREKRGGITTDVIQIKRKISAIPLPAMMKQYLWGFFEQFVLNQLFHSSRHKNSRCKKQKKTKTIYLKALKVNQKQEKQEGSCQLEEGNTGASCSMTFPQSASPISKNSFPSRSHCCTFVQSHCDTCGGPVLECLCCCINLWICPFDSTALEYLN